MSQTLKSKLYHTDTKLQNVQEYIRQFSEKKLNQGCMLKPILFLFGPPGIGKFTVVTHLFNKAGYLTRYLSSTEDPPKDQGGNQEEQLKDCLVYKALNISVRTQWERVAVLLKEVDPYEKLRTPFMQSVLSQYQSEVDRREMLNPIVFVLDSTIYFESHLKSYLSQTFLNACCMLHEFHPLTAKQTEAFLKDQTLVIGGDLSEFTRREIADQANGDLRAAFNMLTMALMTKAPIQTKDQSLGLFHSLGKILYNKRKDPRTGEVQQFQSKPRRQMQPNEMAKAKFYFEPRVLTSKLQCPQMVIRAFLFENSLPFFFDVNEASKYSDLNQDCDRLQNSLIWNEKNITQKEDIDHFITQINTIGYMISNTQVAKIKKRFLRLERPSVFIKNRECRRNQQSLARALPGICSRERGMYVKSILSIWNKATAVNILLPNQPRSKGKSQLSTNTVAFEDDEYESLQDLLQTQKQLESAKALYSQKNSGIEVVENVKVQMNCKALIPPRRHRQQKLSAETLRDLEELINNY